VACEDFGVSCGVVWGLVMVWVGVQDGLVRPGGTPMLECSRFY
jgi:hypothetical protein